MYFKKCALNMKVMKKNQLVVNLIASLIAFTVNLGINFLLAPYITETVGTEAYGFVSLASNFVNYATILTIALNSMAGRFISINIHQNKIDEANKYFTSILVANILIMSFLIVPASLLVLYLDKVLNISLLILLDVKVLFSLIFINFALSVFDATFATSTFVKNRIDLSSRRNVISYIIKAIFLVVLYRIFSPKVFYVGVAACLATFYALVADIYYTKRLLPQIKIKKIYFDIKKLFEVIKSGIWNSITKLGQVLSDGLDLIICNLFISSLAMGQLSIVKTLSSATGTLLSTVSSVFQPELTILYAKNEISSLVKRTKLAMKFSGFFSNIVLGFLVVFGFYFYELWVPNENAKLLIILTILTLQGVFVSGAINPLYSIYTITNKVKADSILRIIISVLDVIIVFLLLKFTDLGVYAVAGTSTLVGMIANFVFVPMYSAYCLKEKKTIFYGVIFRYMLTTVFIIFINFAVKLLIGNISSWLCLIITGMISVLCGITVNFLFLLDRKEKSEFKNFLWSKFKRKEYNL